ncbi:MULTISPECIES: hypothetical protein [Pseudoalteromonas]|uniref:hypothetical protein n=1 Tax=Pseudoalteromonas TaxID=53246 RepID=UPI00029A12CA|nr:MULTISPECIES: hypothetical protein [Pseudoalteromonas]QUI72022.1 hypothetical protein GSF13_20835 [Pseudoalteromonas sp. M8]
MAGDEETKKSVDENQSRGTDILETIRSASRLATKRVYAYAIILILTIGSVYLIITNPDFLHSALSFKTIEDDEGVKELVNFSNQIAQLKSDKAQATSDLNRAKDFKNSLLKDSTDNISLIMSERRLSRRLNEFEVIGGLKSIPISFSYNGFGRSSNIRDTDTLVYSGDIVFSPDVIEKIARNKGEFYLISDDEDVVSEIVKFVKSDKEISTLIEKKYLNLLDMDLVEIDKTVISFDAQLNDLNNRILKIVKRLRSDEYIYASVVLQKVMITMLIVSIGLYFLKALGTDLLFIRKLTIINLSQVIANSSTDDTSKNSVTIYNAFASEEDKSGKASDTIAIKTLGEISKMFSGKTNK